MSNKLNLNTGVVLLILAFLSGCSSTPTVKSLPVISEVEAFRHVKELLAEYEILKLSKPVNKTMVKWIQPLNKKEECKVFVEVGNTDDRTLDDAYKIYWDGGCKNGYANGIGREFERGTILNMNAIALYKGKKERPEYFRNTYNLDDLEITGDLVNNYVVEKKTTDNATIFSIDFISGYTAEHYKTYIASSPFSTKTFYVKQYPNFRYVFTTNIDDFGSFKEQIKIEDKAGNAIGYGIEILRDNRVVHYEMEESGSKIKRQVKLPASYIEKILAVKSEIINNTTKVNLAEKNANIAIKQYQLTICRDSVSVDFIDNTEYKEICPNSEYKAKLKVKINEEFAKFNQQKTEKQQKDYQAKLTDARISQANSAARAARASESANFNQSLQNMNTNTQMQNLNNNLFMMRMGL
jgi:hypothetical protein